MPEKVLSVKPTKPPQVKARTAADPAPLPKPSAQAATKDPWMRGAPTRARWIGKRPGRWVGRH